MLYVLNLGRTGLIESAEKSFTSTFYIYNKLFYFIAIKLKLVDTIIDVLVGHLGLEPKTDRL